MPDSLRASAPTAASAPAEPTAPPAVRSQFGAVAWKVVGLGGGNLLRLASNLVFWRLLTPSAFGLMAIVNTLLQGLSMFSDVGVGPSIVQNRRGDDPEFLNTAWTIQVMRGGIIAVIAAACAWPAAAFYSESALVGLVPVAALGAAIAGFTSTRAFVLSREVNLARATVVDLATQAVGLVTTLAAAFVLRSVWALVLGGVVTALVKVLASHLFLPGTPNRFRWHQPSVHALVRFGRWVFLSTLLTFCVMQADRLVFGRLGSMEELGVYSVAATWATLPVTTLVAIYNAVLFPALSRARERDGVFSATYLPMRGFWLLIGGWATSVVIIVAPALIEVLYDARAESAVWMIQVLAAGSWFLIMESVNGTALLAHGTARWNAAGSFVKLVGMLVLLPLGHHLAGFPGAVVGFAASEPLRYLVSTVATRRFGILALGQDALQTLGIAATLTVGLLLRPWIASVIVPLLPSRGASVVAATGTILVITVPWFVAVKRSRGRLAMATRGAARA